jgi:putative transposase
MKKTRFTDTQIVAMLKQRNQGYPPKRSVGNTAFSEATFYNWRSRYRGIICNFLSKLSKVPISVEFAPMAIFSFAIKNLFSKTVCRYSFQLRFQLYRKMGF